MNLRTTLAAAAAAIVLAGGPLAAVAADKDVITYRNRIMESLGAHAGGIGDILQNKVENKENLAHHANSIALSARAAVSAFGPNVPGDEAKAEIWDNWEEFEGRFVALAEAAEVVAAAAEAGEALNFGDPRMQAMLTCKACHDKFRDN